MGFPVQWEYQTGEKIKFDDSKNDGTPRKLIDISFIKSLGWKPRTDLKEGLEKTYLDFCKNYI